MGFLVCKKCGGYYELQEGESADDYEYCSCGGQIEYRENLEDLNITSKSFKNKIKCSNCGTYIPENVSFCGSCGMKVKTSEDQIKKVMSLLNYRVLLIGSLLVVIVFIISSLFSDFSNNMLFYLIPFQYENNLQYENNNLASFIYILKIVIYILILLGVGIFVGMLTKRNYKKSALHGILIYLPPTIFGFTCLYTYIDIIFRSPDLSMYIIKGIVVIMLLPFLGIFLLLGIVGSVLGTYIYNKFNLSENSRWLKIENRLSENTAVLKKDDFKIAYISFVVTVLLLSFWSII